MTLLRPALLLAALLTVAGCGTPSQPLAMAITPAQALQLRAWVPDALRGQVSVAAVRGGEETGRWWGSKVSAAALQQALTESLVAVGMQPLAPEPATRFELRSELVQLEQPLIAAGVTVSAAVQYRLVERASGRTVYQRRLSNAHTAELSEALLSQPERTRLANERALQVNIGMLLRELVTLRP